VLGKGIERMKKLVGIFIVVQAILTGLILYGLNSISNSILISAVHQKTGVNTIAWSDNLDTLTYIVLVTVLIVGGYLIVTKDKHSR
jgi:hypothetical protein